MNRFGAEADVESDLQITKSLTNGWCWRELAGCVAEKLAKLLNLGLLVSYTSKEHITLFYQGVVFFLELINFGLFHCFIPERPSGCVEVFDLIAGSGEGRFEFGNAERELMVRFLKGCALFFEGGNCSSNRRETADKFVGVWVGRLAHGGEKAIPKSCF